MAPRLVMRREAFGRLTQPEGAEGAQVWRGRTSTESPMRLVWWSRMVRRATSPDMTTADRSALHRGAAGIAHAETLDGHHVEHLIVLLVPDSEPHVLRAVASLAFDVPR